MLKNQNGCFPNEKLKVELSRQRIADMVGLRVETVIRAMKQLEQKGLISIQKGKVYV
jgi:CRP-like cAMP-binding protein